MLLHSCTNDKIETDPCSEITYSETVKPLIHTKCALTGCHVSGFTPGDFTNYDVIRRKVTEGKIQLMVFELDLMPPDDTLTSDEKDKLKCWMSGGALNN